MALYSGDVFKLINSYSLGVAINDQYLNNLANVSLSQSD